VYFCEASDDFDTVQSADIQLNVVTTLPTAGPLGLVFLSLAILHALQRLTPVAKPRPATRR
jgi:hypothetical protein